MLEFQQAAQKMDMTDELLASALDGMEDPEIDELADLEVDKVSSVPDVDLMSHVSVTCPKCPKPICASSVKCQVSG